MERKTLGCVFKNPDIGNRSAGELIDLAGMKGRCSGGAMVSEKHANFIVNRGHATAADVLALIAQAGQKVYDRFGVRLATEICIRGEDA